MALKEVGIIYDMMDDSSIDGSKFIKLFESLGVENAEFSNISVPYEPPEDITKNCDFLTIKIYGSNGKHSGGTAPTLGIIGRLGAQGAQPHRIGQVSDADGSTVALSAAYKILNYAANGSQFEGDVIITTHVATHVSITPHDPVDFMGMPVSSDTMNKYEVLPEMDAILSIDTSKGNAIIKQRGIAISATAKQGYILRVSPDLVSVMEVTTGKVATTFPITTQDITPYDNGAYHFNSIMQPHVATDAPVVGLAITAGSIVPGSDTGGSYETELTDATRFAVEVAKQFTWNKITFYNSAEYNLLFELYGDMSILQGP